MNCKPRQLAYIVVPARVAFRGLEQLNGHVVQTIALLPNQDEPIWEVTPQQWVTFTQGCRDARGVIFNEGERVPAEGIPDSFLRPFDPNSEPVDEPATSGLELES